MVAIIISEKGGPQRRMEFDKSELTIGRVQGNDLILSKGNVSKRHARIVVKDGKFIIVDLKSTNGTYVNGRKIQSPQVIKSTDKIYIGDFIISLDVSDIDNGPGSDVSPPRSSTDGMGDPALQVGGPSQLRPSRPARPGDGYPLEAQGFTDGQGMGFGDAGALFPEFGGPPYGEAKEDHPAGPLELSFEGAASPFDMGGAGDRGIPHPSGPPVRDYGPPPPPAQVGPPLPSAAPAMPPPAPPPLGMVSGQAAPLGMPPAQPPGPAVAPMPLASPPPMPPSPAPLAQATTPPVPPAHQTAPPQFSGGPPVPPGAAVPVSPQAAAAAPTHPSAPSSPAPPPAAPASPAPSSGHRATTTPATPAAPVAAPAPPGRPTPPPRPRALGPAPLRPAKDSLGKELERHQAQLRAIAERLDAFLAPLTAERLSWEAFRERAENALYDIVAQLESQRRLPAGANKETIIQDALNEATAFGPLEDLLMDETVREILVNDPLHIYVNRGVELEREQKCFSDEASLLAIIRRLLQDTGVVLDAARPSVDVRRKDGIRVTALLPPVAVRGPVLSLRRNQLEPLAMDDLIANETMSPAMAELLEACVRAGKNIIVAGGAGAGKTTLLNCLAAGIPTEERIITIEDGCELVLPQENVVTLETRSATDGQPEIGSGQLVGFAQRLRPDRLVVGDLSGEDALELLRAMNSGCGGVLSCVHAQDAHGALERMETMCLMGGRDLPVRTLRELISTGMDLLVVLTRYSSGERKVTGIFEVASLDVDLVNLEEIFRFEAEGTDRNGAVLGRFRATGFVPRLFDDLQRRGLAPSPDVFR